MPSPRMTAGHAVDASLRAQMQRIQEEIPVDAGGGASLIKALILGDLIVTHDLGTVVELGVYRGRLLLALGRLLTGLNRGEVIGIDPYSAQAAVQSDAHERVVDLSAWPFEQDWEAIHRGAVTAIERWQIGDRTLLIRERSQDAVRRFGPGSIDLLHIDANHDARAVTADLQAYLPAVRRGGFVVLDDASWPSVSDHCRRLAAHQRLVFSLFDSDLTLDGVGGNDFAVFQIIRGPGEPT